MTKGWYGISLRNSIFLVRYSAVLQAVAETMIEAEKEMGCVVQLPGYRHFDHIRFLPLVHDPMRLEIVPHQITFRVQDFPDIKEDGSFTMGASVAAFIIGESAIKRRIVHARIRNDFF